MKKVVVLLLLAAMIATGCTGSFILTQKVYRFHRGLDNQWMDEVGFLVCVILPVYGIATFADAVILNTVEFWTGENPAEGYASAEKVILEGNKVAVMQHLPDGSIRLESEGRTFVLARRHDGVVARDCLSGKTYTARTLSEGQVAVLDDAGNMLSTIQ